MSWNYMKPFYGLAEENGVYKNKRVLLIGGGGTLGTYTAEELLRRGALVDILCPEEKQAVNENLHFYRAYATEAVLRELLERNRYDGIVNYLHYPDAGEYKPIHKLLTDNTAQLIFLSSYRVYADLEHPITENAPLLLDVTDDRAFLEKETYAVSKARAEKFIQTESGTKNWTIVRPVISFSDKRFDLVTWSGREIIDMAKKGEPILLPGAAEKLTAGLDWAGNSGRLIANLLFKERAWGETYTISSAQNLSWGEVAAVYAGLLKAKIEWVTLEEYIQHNVKLHENPWILKYDRLFDRRIDNRKVLETTGLQKGDFISIEEGIKIELYKVV